MKSMTSLIKRQDCGFSIPELYGQVIGIRIPNISIVESLKDTKVIELRGLGTPWVNSALNL